MNIITIMLKSFIMGIYRRVRTKFIVQPEDIPLSKNRFCQSYPQWNRYIKSREDVERMTEYLMVSPHGKDIRH